MAYILLTTLHILVCLFLIVVVLLQSGKAADLAGAFGGMGSQTAFGPRGSATLLSKATTASAILFMVTSLSLSIVASKSAGVGSTILEKHPAPASAQQPAAPATPGTPVVPGNATPGGPIPGQPSVTLTDPATGKQQTVPLNIPPPPQQPPDKK